jgi:serine phosphatase RsbU (regulator of sigma subunit)
LGRALNTAPPDGAGLEEILEQHIPLMFPNSRAEVRLFPSRTLLHTPATASAVPEMMWEWVQELDDATFFLSGESLPMGVQSEGRTIVVVPLLHVESGQTIGGFYLSLSRWGIGPVNELLPAAQAVAAQIASALHGVEIYERNLAHQRLEQELELAGTIQGSFLPRSLPNVDGWEFAVWLAPARQTSGDFVDWIDLPGGRLGFVIADVADKGLGAALFMALSRTLIRTFAVSYPDRPELALQEANLRILSDTNTSMFVTAFFGVLDPITSTLTYCNAGHNPPYLLRHETLQKLEATGMPLGILEELTWRAESLEMEPGDLLLLYTDGVVEAENSHTGFLGTERMLAAACAVPERSAQRVQQAVIDATFAWMGDTPQHDDITMMVLARNAG